MKDNKDQSSNTVPSPLLKHFRKNVQQVQQTPLSTHRSMSKIPPNNHHPNQSFLTHNRQFTTNMSRKKLQQPVAQLQQKYQQIQQILMNQNYNLKQQNQYLTSEIRRVTKKEKQMRHQLDEITYRSRQQKDYILKLQQNLSQLNGFLAENIQTLILVLQTNSLSQLKSCLSFFIDGISDILSLDNEQKVKSKEINSNANLYPAEAWSIDQEIENLGARLQILLKQNNNSCRDPNVRRECIGIAKQMKQLQNKKKTPQFQKDFNDTSMDIGKKQAQKHSRKNSAYEQKTQRLSLNQQRIVKKQQSIDKFKYPKQIYSKVTHRRSASKESKLKHMASMHSMLNKKEKH